jgi:hypothetical protein
MSEPTAMTYVGLKVPHHILKRAFRRFRGRLVDEERDGRLWNTADSWVEKTLSKDDLSAEDLDDTGFSMKELLRAIDDIHGRELAADVYEYVDDLDEKTEDECDWVLNERAESGFHLVGYHNWVMDAVNAVTEDKNNYGEEESEEDSEHFGVADVTLWVEEQESGPVQVCVTLWSEAQELPRRGVGTKFTSSAFSELSRIVQSNLVKLNALMDKLGISVEEWPRKIEVFTGVSN